MNLVVVDAGMGNLRSVERALEEAARRVSQSVKLTRSGDPNVVRAADVVVFPGQGAFRDCARALDGGLREAITGSIAAGKPYLGLCLGLQALFATSEEAGESCRGLAIYGGTVRKLEGAPGVKIPHMGWNTVEPERRGGLLGDSAEHYYFVHSFVVVPSDPSLAAGTTEHGSRFVSAVERDNVFATQFHPEKSQSAGLSLLGRFLERA